MVCPYCEQESALLPMHRALRTGAAALALLGCLSLYLMARMGGVPLVRTGDISELMDHACVQVAGAVVDDPYVGRREGVVDYVSFCVDDGSGRVRVCAYDETARALLDESLVPVRDAAVSLTGTVRCAGPDRVRVRLRSVRDVRTVAGSDGRVGELATTVPRTLVADAGSGAPDPVR